MANRKLKFLIHPLEGTGHLNACIGFAQSLADRGHECVFAINESITSSVQKFGFRTEVLIQNPEPADKDEKKGEDEEKFAYSDNPAKDMGAALEKMGAFTHKTAYEKLEAFKTNPDEADFMKKVQQILIKFNPQLEEIIAKEKFDCFVLDHFFFPPAFGKKDIPCIMVLSAAPLSYYDSPLLPPGGSGYPMNDKSQWEKFRTLMNEVNDHYHVFQRELDEQCNFKNDNFYTTSGFFKISPFLNVYQYPKELDYLDIYKPPSNFISMDAFCRNEATEFELPEAFKNAHANGEKLIYFSMGSMGSFDIKLMQRVTAILSKMPNIKTIVSKGPRGEEYELPENCWGENSLPQPAVIEKVDLVITHGGNNSLTETFAAGKPMIVCPLFGDQGENGERVQETGYGRRIEPYNFKDEELIKAINELLNDEDMKKRLEAAKLRIQTEKTKEKVAKRVEEMLLNR